MQYGICNNGFRAERVWWGGEVTIQVTSQWALLCVTCWLRESAVIDLLPIIEATQYRLLSHHTAAELYEQDSPYVYNGFHTMLRIVPYLDLELFHINTKQKTN